MRNTQPIRTEILVSANGFPGIREAEPEKTQVALDRLLANAPGAFTHRQR
jgi:hypothetical protein